MSVGMSMSMIILAFSQLHSIKSQHTHTRAGADTNASLSSPTATVMSRTLRAMRCTIVFQVLFTSQTNPSSPFLFHTDYQHE
mmetsp:Transcript_8768/g.23672  ORF Transcript_8768/g.23672 Transcript_8768/m.23672 type:complete len:82 (-) Transcript_8768:447-692(-)